MTEFRINWRDSVPRTVEEMRKILDDDLRRIAEITRTPPIFLAPLDEGTKRFIDSHERDVSPMQQMIEAVRRRANATPPGTIPLHWDLGDDSFTFTMHDEHFPIPKTKTKDTTMTTLPNGGTLFAKLTISGDSEDGTLTAYETLLDAARRIGVENATDITLDQDGDPTIEVDADEIDLHALADLVQPREDKALPADEPEPEQSSVVTVGWWGARAAFRYDDGSLMYSNDRGHWMPASANSIVAQEFVSGLRCPIDYKGF